MMMGQFPILAILSEACIYIYIYVHIPYHEDIVGIGDNPLKIRKMIENMHEDFRDLDLPISFLKKTFSPDS